MNINVLKEFLYTDLLVKQYITVKLECQFILIKFNNLALIVSFHWINSNTVYIFYSHASMFA